MTPFRNLPAPAPPRRARPGRAGLAGLAALWLLLGPGMPGAQEAGDQQPAPEEAPAEGAAGEAAQAPGEGAAGEAAVPARGEARYRWERQLYGRLGGREVLLYSGSTRHAKLTFGDLDGDGDKEMLLGKADGHIDLFENRGGPGEPDWRLVRENIRAVFPGDEGQGAPGPRVIAVGAHAAPALVDIDADGDQDLFVGSADGRLLFFRNLGNPHLPSFHLENERFVSRRFGQRLVPHFADVNGDRQPDLLLGNARGEVYLLPNQGRPRRAKFCVEFPRPDALPEEPPPCRPVPRRLARVSPTTHAVPAAADWDGDGDLDLFVGKSDGTIAYHPNRGDRFGPDWRLLQERFLAIDSGGFAAPAFADVNGDRRPDLLVGSGTDRVELYTARNAVNVLDIYRIGTNYLDVRRFRQGQRRVAVTSGDLDGDGDRDLLLGDASGRLMRVDNTGGEGTPAWTVAETDVLPDPARRDAVPHLADLDGDGDLDLLVGDRNGRLGLIRNEGDAGRPRWSLESTQYAGIDVGDHSAPLTHDVDGDGDPDLIIGNGNGLLILYRNEGDPGEPDFRLASTRYAGLNAGAQAVPAPFDWDGDGRADLLVGNRQGRLVLSLDRSEAAGEVPTQWERRSDAWLGIRVEGPGLPHVADLDGDDRPDLMVGDDAGNVRLWWNRGVRPALAHRETPPQTGEEPAGEAGEAGAEEGAPAGAAGGEEMRTAAAPQEPAEGSPFSALQAEGGTAVAAAEGGGPGGAPAEPRGPVPPAFTLVNREFGGIRMEGKAVPAFADLDGDGDQDLVVGDASGALVHYRNIGSPQQPRWEEVGPGFVDTGGAPRPAPVFADFNGDGRLDLLVGTEAGGVFYFRGSSGPEGYRFTRVGEGQVQVQVKRNASPAVTDLDGDGRADLLVGNFNGKLVAFVRQGEGDPPPMRLSSRRFLSTDVGIAATPFVGDVDLDGRPDLLVGSDQGNVLNFTKLANTVENPWGWEQQPAYLEGLTFPLGTTPRLTDIDGDADADLFVGTESGTIYFYRNDANPQATQTTP